VLFSVNLFCFEKQFLAGACTVAFKEFEKFGFEFREICFGGNQEYF